MSFVMFNADGFDSLGAQPPRPQIAAHPRGGASLDHFVGRRRSGAVGVRFWRFLAANWSDFDPIARARAARMFARFRPDWRRETLSPADRAFYDRLPETFAAYRGQNGAELAIGAGFALSLDSARRQAALRRGADSGDTRVFALAAAKRDVALVFAADGEIVMFPAPRIDLRARRLIEVAN